ncbi:MAG: IMP dehydrogenase [Candidatus Muirbacterium halophilum]|nr:IMP dehydrogenase [Candidatus Muirbacterium halophilum]MCK9475931.1 IMP dehydrogenase [Candidatus Muirbacterium halophilum]
MFKIDPFMNNFPFNGLTFDDVSLVVQYSEVLPKETILKTKLTSKIELFNPFVSAAMDTVTEWKMATELARLGCIGIIHKNMTIEEQSLQVAKVKKFLNGFIEKPVFIYEDNTIEEIFNMKVSKEYNFSSFPVIERNTQRLKGIFTSHDMKFVVDYKDTVKKHMTSKVVYSEKNINFNKAYGIMLEKKISKLPVVDKDNKLAGLFCLNDIKGIVAKAPAIMNVDEKHRLICGAAVSVHDYDRIDKLIKEKVDVIIIDTAHGHTKGVLETLKKVKDKYSNIQIIAGNIATSQAALDLYNAGADGVKVGIGPGSICTTRVVAGVGIPQITAIYECSKALRGKIPVIADGGIRYSGDVAKAIGAGASTVMMGSNFAGTEESPGEKILYNGRKYVAYRGMGSLAAMKTGEGSRKRYFQDEVEDSKLVPEGIEGMVPYSGTIADVIYQFIGGLRSSMGYCGVKTIEEFHKNSVFTKVSPAGLKEAHPHDITITKEAPNYKK